MAIKESQVFHLRFHSLGTQSHKAVQPRVKESHNVPTEHAHIINIQDLFVQRSIQGEKRKKWQEKLLFSLSPLNEDSFGTSRVFFFSILRLNEWEGERRRLSGQNRCIIYSFPVAEASEMCACVRACVRAADTIKTSFFSPERRESRHAANFHRAMNSPRVRLNGIYPRNGRREGRKSDWVRS